jgi:fructokinase
VARGWLAGRRTQLVVVTLGPYGAWAASHRLEVEAPAPAVRVVDTVGAGDTFMAALVDGLLDGPEAGSLDAPALEAVLRRACVAAAICCAREGADPPSRDELDASLGVTS